jgi:hypothetical protein
MPGKKNQTPWQWRVFLQQVCKHGRYHPPKFLNSITQNLIDI